MKFSLITPTHNPKYINDLYASIKAQTYTDWEWIILLNNDATKLTLSYDITSDPRVFVSCDDTGNTNVGYLKKIAFGMGTGDVLVEMDHDDMLLPTCLEKLNLAFSDPDVGFVYSDNAKLQTNAQFQPYNPVYGWTFHTIPYNGDNLIVMDSFLPDAASLAFIWYMPDHVRAWRTRVYHDVGGHDENLDVLDDQDLIVRTYLKHKFHYIAEALYIYRIDGSNTWTDRMEKIQRDTVTMYYKYAYALAERDADINKLMKVDIGGGIDGRTGYITIDQECGHINCDLNDGIPLPDNSVGVINASHVLEHLKDGFKSMSEIYRVLADGGWVFIDVPSTDGRGAFQDPTHVSFWNSNSFWYYTDRSLARYIRNDKIRFQEFRRENGFQNQWQKDHNIVVTTVWLRAIKSDSRRPHWINI